MGRQVETFTGGLDNPLQIKGASRTGYYLRRFLGNFEQAAAYSNQQRTFPIFRYAELMLNYAEAINEVNEAASNRVEAFNQLKAIRLRAGIPLGITAGYQHGLKINMTQAELREAIRNERRIELAFEEHRFWGVRRWKIADLVAKAEVNGVVIKKNLPELLAI